MGVSAQKRSSTKKLGMNSGCINHGRPCMAAWYHRDHPHPNIVKYHDCKVEDGMIVGFCLSKYSKTLTHLIWANADIDVDACLDGIKKGIVHLHSLGFIHSDLTTRNIIFCEGDDRARFPVIVDFDACRKEGEKLGL
jgi:serine/threonine protein kinase